MRLIEPGEDYVGQGYWKNENIYVYLDQAATQCPERTALVDRFGRYTNRHLDDSVRSLAVALEAIGIGRGDVVSFQLPNWSEAAVVHQATVMIGAISNPIIPIYRHREVEYILATSGAKLLFLPHDFRNFNYLQMARDLYAKLPALQQVLVIDKFGIEPELDAGERLYSHFLESGMVNEEVTSIEAVSVHEDDPALLLYTSGTTAEPKGVIHTHNTLLHEVRTMARWHELDAKDVIFMPSPVTHITGILCGLMLPFIIQGRAVYQDVWNANEGLQLLVDEECTWTLSATPFLRGILQQFKKATTEQSKPKLKLKTVGCGGADMPPELILEASRVLECYVARMYGSSEFPSLTTCGPCWDSQVKAAYTDGRLFEGSSAKIVDEYGSKLPPGEVGEIAAKGPDMFLGYVQPEHNEDTFTEDGYFLTGDLAVVDEEGYFEIKGRKKDIIIRGGENISVKEVEDLLYEHSKIHEVAIVAMPDAEMGEKACAYVMLEQGETLSFDELTEFLLERKVARQKLPERHEVLEQMPTTASGKVQKFLLKKDIQEKLERGV